MKLHRDGTIEGTPEEIMKYQQLKPLQLKPLDATTSVRSPLSGAVTGQTCLSSQQSSARYDANAQTTSV
ncbi:hypothetical protein [Paenibacillus sp. FSL M7-0896]|uniref:hypothetical protein n=1 Tax=Paenibacillus sp. FSL M7-0896 TaxID=2921610 RepID=UPI0030D72308